MAYNYYQTQVPGWGTSQFQFGAPPRPGFQPQPSWKGYDFYNAHAMNPDPGLFDNIMTRIRNGLGLGISHSDARHWHKKVYSGLVPLTQLLPEDIGAAAAYEAYRTWKHNSFLYEPLSADRERQREGLSGMAIAETQRLWQYSQRALDTYNLRAACEAAASVASVLADRLFASSGGVGRASSYASSGGDAYGYDDSYRRSRSRHNSFSTPTVVRVGGSPLMGGAALPYGTPSTVPMPIAGAAMSAGSPYGAGIPGSYGSYGTPYSGPQPGLPGSNTYGGASPNTYGGASPNTYGGASPNPYGGAPPNAYGGATPNLYGGASPNPYGSAVATPSPYTYNGVPVGYGGGGAGQYGAGAYTLPNGQTVPPGSTVIITQPHRSRRHSTASSRHHHRKSSDVGRFDDYDRERERERELEREREARDWERADRERHERDRVRWEREERERERALGTEGYGRYPTMGSSSYDGGAVPGYGGYGRY
ncbi:hypothetical protein C8Q80DRAFT_867012 [Daedaleopsis nitida]|nr:hypothetical protein C8Q80DRAFT_867012 [Daedaleopsis nitida]